MENELYEDENFEIATIAPVFKDSDPRRLNEQYKAGDIFALPICGDHLYR